MKPEPLIDAHLDGALDGAGCRDLRDWLMADDAHMRRFAKHLMFEQEISDAVHTRQGVFSANRFAPSPKPASRFARAAAWLGGFAWLGNKSQVAAATGTSILMTKTASTAITAAILISGGGSLYLIQRDNQQAAARVEVLEKSSRTGGEAPADHPEPGAKPSPDDPAPAQAPGEMLARWRNLFTGEASANDKETAKELLGFHQKLGSMDAGEFAEIAEEAERMGDLPNTLVSLLIQSFAKKSPEGAAVHGARLAVDAREFDLAVIATTSNAFETWLASDPEAAGAWYREAAASGSLVQKTIPPEGKETFALHRTLARIRFSALLGSDPQEAEAMAPSMLPDDVVMAVDAAREKGRMDAEQAAGWLRRFQPDAPKEEK